MVTYSSRSGNEKIVDNWETIPCIMGKMFVTSLNQNVLPQVWHTFQTTRGKVNFAPKRERSWLHWFLTSRMTLFPLHSHAPQTHGLEWRADLATSPGPAFTVCLFTSAASVRVRVLWWIYRVRGAGNVTSTASCLGYYMLTGSYLLVCYVCSVDNNTISITASC